MRAFEVHLNGEKLCLAGVEGDGVLSAITSFVVGKGGSDLFLEIGGLDSSSRDHLDWVNQKPLAVGDEINLKVVEIASVDAPISRRSAASTEQAENQKAFVRAMERSLAGIFRRVEKIFLHLDRREKDTISLLPAPA